MHTVGLLNHTGKIGSAVLGHLLKAHQAGTIKLTILHRPSSDVSSLPADVDKRVIDLEGDSSAIKSAVTGLNVIISAVPTQAVMSQIPLIEALAGSRDLVTLIPSEYGLEWTDKELEQYPQLSFLTGKDQVSAKARELKVPVTIVHNGSFQEFFLMFPLFGANVKENKVDFFRKSRQNLTPFSTIPYVGAGIAQLALSRPSEIANKTYDFTEYELTGQNIIDDLTKAHGSPTQVTETSEESWKAGMDAGGIPTIAAGIKRKWGDGDFARHGVRTKVEGFQTQGFLAAVQQSLKA